MREISYLNLLMTNGVDHNIRATMEAPIPDGVNLSQSLAVRVIDPFQFHE
jgi:hypothetical protein